MRGLSLQKAEEILNSSRAIINTMALPPMTVVILDNGGILKVAFSEDGAGLLRVKIAEGKAKAALGMGFNSARFYDFLTEKIISESFAQAINGTAGGEFIPVPGGCLILDENENLLGAIGISGASSKIDEEIAQKSIRKTGLRSPI